MFLYVMSGSDGCCKVGVSHDPKYRRVYVSYIAKARRPIVVCRTYWVEQQLTAYNIERAAHKTLARHRQDGEWFKASVELCARALRAEIKRKGLAVRKAPKKVPFMSLRAYNAWRDAEE